VSMTPRSPLSTLFPYTTLFRSHVAVLGLGRFGTAVALELVQLGHEVLGIDSDIGTVQALSNELSHVVQADVTDEEALARLGISRSEEHTSELQSRENLVCRLLL